MSKSGVIYTNPENLRTNKIMIAAKYSGVDLKKADDFVLGETNKSADYLTNFPCGSVPAYKSNDNKCLSESNAIAYYVANDKLRGKNDYETACILQWVHFGDAEITPPLATLVFDMMGIKKENPKELEKAKTALNHALAVLDDYLRTRTYLVGEYITLADIACYCAIYFGIQQGVLKPDECGSKHVNMFRWFQTCINQPEAKSILTQGCAPCSSVAPPKKEEKKQEKKKEEKKKEEKKKEEKKPAKEEEEDDDGEPKKAPETDPFGALPPGTFKMDEWKRTFSNNDFTAVSLPYFWQNFDKANYSMWFCEYKYPEDLTQVFMTCNLVTGMFQRLDRMRKHSFGVMSIFGVKNDNTITGFFIWRGHDLAFKLAEDLQVDYESYDWRKVDADSEEAKQLVLDYFGRNDKTEWKGKKFNQCFVWK